MFLSAQEALVVLTAALTVLATTTDASLWNAGRHILVTTPRSPRRHPGGWMTMRIAETLRGGSTGMWDDVGCAVMDLLLLGETV